MAGALVAIPLLIVGLSLSEMRPQVGEAKGFQFGTSIILELLCLLRFGEFSFNATIHLHATAIAAWFGLFVTAMNLLPIGQLDGGHVIYPRFRTASGSYHLRYRIRVPYSSRDYLVAGLVHVRGSDVVPGFTTPPSPRPLYASGPQRPTPGLGGQLCCSC